MIRRESRSRSFELAAEYNDETGERRSIVLTSTTESKDATEKECEFPKGIRRNSNTIQKTKKINRQLSIESDHRRNSGVDHQRRRRRTSSRNYSRENGSRRSSGRLTPPVVSSSDDEVEVKPVGFCSSICWTIHDALFGKCDYVTDGADVDFFG